MAAGAEPGAGEAHDLIAFPNVSEGRDEATIEAIAEAFATAGARVLDQHSDADHNRTAYTLAGRPGQLASAVLSGAEEAVERIEMTGHEGVHPCVGALDVAAIVHLDDARRGAACAEALVLADELARRLGLPVFLYGELGGGRERADVRTGGLPKLTARMAAGELAPDFGPATPHPTAGATLVAARPPLVAFNLVLTRDSTHAQASEIAAAIRASAPGGGGLPGLKAIGVELADGSAQVSMNVEDHVATPLARVVEAVRARAEVSHAELVGLAPRAAFDGFPDDLPIPGFDPQRHLL
jgi:glutamate formiminotransferase